MACLLKTIADLILLPHLNCKLPQPKSGHPLIRQPAGRITRLTVLDTHGVQTNSFRCADCMQIELEFNLDEPIDRPLIPTRCATSTAKSYSGPTRSSWALRFQGLPLGVTSIASSRHYLFGFKIIWRRLTGYSGHRPANIVPSIDQSLPPDAVIPHRPLLMIAQFATRQLLPLQAIAAKPTDGL